MTPTVTPDTELLLRVERDLCTAGRLTTNRPAHRARCSATGVTLSQPSVGVLGSLAQDGPARQRDLALRLGLDRSILAREVGRLADSGLVERPKVRLGAVTITDEGRCAYDLYRRALAEHLAEHLGSWSQPDLTHLAELLERLTEDFSRPCPPVHHPSPR